MGKVIGIVAAVLLFMFYIVLPFLWKLSDTNIIQNIFSHGLSKTGMGTRKTVGWYPYYSGVRSTNRKLLGCQVFSSGLAD
ncbi:hypothetical protein PIB30_018856 [Stylosanthes scabra]|uniref:Uncharacterized protein n=1 Tax=Stylosanthes scabra TaxID=79078 RepID=A0ABU6UB83_9FABA|nr:hypothetical protein [Stylosanthes scabra]